MIDEGAPTQEPLETIYNTVQALPVTDRAELIYRILGDPELSVSLVDNDPNRGLAVQLSTMETDQLAQLVRAIANRIDPE